MSILRFSAISPSLLQCNAVSGVLHGLARLFARRGRAYHLEMAAEFRDGAPADGPVWFFYGEGQQTFQYFEVCDRIYLHSAPATRGQRFRFQVVV